MQDKAVLFTNDAANMVARGAIKNTLITLDFGTASNASIEYNWKLLRKHQPKGPLVVAEFYPGRSCDL